MNDINVKEVIILGMHRSGTSMIGGVLSRLGVDMGNDKPGRQVSNPMGHYEDGNFLELNETILTTAGGTWNDPPPLEKINKLAGSYNGRLQEIMNLRRLSNREQHWGWKDPRTCLTVQLYLPYLTNPYVIWCERYPADIAKSLWKRNKISHEVSENLTEHYQQQIRNFIKMHPEIPVLKVNYQDIVREPDPWIQKIVDFLDLGPNREQRKAAREFILPKAKIQREKKILWWKYLLSLPVRFLKKIKIISD